MIAFIRRRLALPTTPDDLIASDPPPAFPPWMVKADPRLAGQESNRIYQAYRRRRMLYPQGRGWRWRGIRWSTISTQTLIQSISGVLLIGVWVGLSLWPGAPPVSPCFAVMLLSWVVPWILRSVGGTEDHGVAEAGGGGELPKRLVGGYDSSAPVIVAETLYFLWWVGASGREVVEAVYLESRESDRRNARLVFGFLGLLGFIPIVIGRWGTDEPTWWTVPPSMAWMGWCVAMAYWLPRRQRPLVQIHRLVRSWQRINPRYTGVGGALSLWLARDFRHALARLWRAVGVVIVIVLLIGALIATGVMLGGRALSMALTVLGLFLVVGTPWLTRMGLATSESRLAELFNDADEAFAFYSGWALYYDPDEVRAMLIREGKLGLDDPWPPRDLEPTSSSA